MSYVRFSNAWAHHRSCVTDIDRCKSDYHEARDQEKTGHLRGAGGAISGVGGDPRERFSDATVHVRPSGDGARPAEGDDTDQTEPAGDIGHQRTAAVAHADRPTAFLVATGADHAARKGPLGSAAALTPDWHLDVLENGCLRLGGPNTTVAAGDGRSTGVRLTGSRQADGDNGVGEGDLPVQLQQREVPASAVARVLRMIDDLLDREALLAGIRGADP